MSGSMHVHFVGVCGYAVSGAALTARQLGHTVTGSDEDAYPPTTDTLTAAGITWVNHFAAENLDIGGAPDLVVVANGVRPGNVEWDAARARGIRVISEMEFFAGFAAQRTRIAVCGTHGKTTTASLLVWMLETARLSPGFRLGSTSRDLGLSARAGGDGPFVFEGDEYTTSPWDARAKFLHIHPQLACVTRLELDHPDVYPDLEAYRRPFVELAATMPSGGRLLLCADDPECLRLAEHATARVATYGTRPEADWCIVAAADEARPRRGDAAQTFSVRRGRDTRTKQVSLTLPGEHNRLNAVAAWFLASMAGAPDDACLEACATFRGASRRFEVVGEVDGITVVDDYAHHPTEVAATVSAARARHPSGRVLAVYVPHTYSRTLALLDAYATSFSGADLVVLGPIEAARERHLAHTVSSEDVAARVRGAAPARVVTSAEEAIVVVSEAARSGDVILCMSVRGFDDVARRTVAALEAQRVH